MAKKKKQGTVLNGKQAVRYWQRQGFSAYGIGFISGNHHRNPYPKGSNDAKEWNKGRRNRNEVKRELDF